MIVSRQGLLLLNKKPGATSFESLSAVKKAFATGKVGHTGTLDKFASGLLLVLVGRAVKLAPLFEKCAKEYTAALLFGAETDTLDPEGAIIATGKFPSREDVEAVLHSFRGAIFQSPPAYSAVHIGGRRAHELAREGKTPEMKKRPVTVFALEILRWEPPEAVIHVRCSSGTYIRSLARDIALAAGSRAHLIALERTRIGDFCLDDAVNGDDAKIVNALRQLDRKFFEALSLPYFFLDSEAENGFLHGKSLETLLPARCFTDAEAAGIFRESEKDELLGVIMRKDSKWVYGHVFGGNQLLPISV